MKTSIANWGDPTEVLARLEGDWTLVRNVDGRPLLKGGATFDANGDGSLTYRECGRMRLADGQEFEAHRSYLFRPSPFGFSVFFFESPFRLFHEIALENAKGRLLGEAFHSCRADLYLSRYEFLAPGAFSICHEVSGPRKGYTLETSYQRNSAQFSHQSANEQ